MVCAGVVCGCITKVRGYELEISRQKTMYNPDLYYYFVELQRKKADAPPATVFLVSIFLVPVFLVFVFKQFN